jgi:hypothetical protein
MLYLLYIIVFIAVYLLIGAAYAMIEMDKWGDWDNFVMVFWPIIIWRQWRLSCYLKRQNKKWER